MALTLNYVALTDVGLRRSTNQDSGYASHRLLVIADGMGGAAAGDLASSAAMGIISRVDREPDGDALDQLGEAVERANHRLGELVQADPAVEGMGTTLEAMYWDGARFATAHIGDSRAYRLRDGVLEQVSTDHTFVQSLVDEGKLTPAEARVHPHRSLLLRVLLGRDDNEADIGWRDGQEGDRFLLCSDGLSDMVEFDRIAELLAAPSIDVAATELVRAALEAGGYDNVTVVIGELRDVTADPEADELACADGRPQLVGAAADGPRARTGQETSDDGEPVRTAAVAESAPAAAIDPEELRYAPRPPSRLRWLRRILVLVVLVAIVVGVGYGGYRWSQQQYFVADDGGRVTVFRGVQADLPLVTLQHVESRSDVELDDLTDFQARQVRAGIMANNRLDANKIVDDLRSEAAASPDATPSPSTSTPTPTRTPRTQRAVLVP